MHVCMHGYACMAMYVWLCFYGYVCMFSMCVCAVCAYVQYACICTMYGYVFAMYCNFVQTKGRSGIAFSFILTLATLPSNLNDVL